MAVIAGIVMPMLQLTYISTASYDLAPTAMGEILSASRRNNAAAALTGLLLYDGRRFLQALEGEAAMVNRAYERIKADRRHRAIVLLSRSDVAVRAFGNWDMAAQTVSAVAGGSVAELVERMTAEVADPTMQALFRSFARVRAAA